VSKRLSGTDHTSAAWATALLVVICAGFCAVAYVQAMQEAATYNRLTGADVTAWDALFVELRVEGSIK
jgi:hypothetical protein